MNAQTNAREEGYRVVRVDDAWLCICGNDYQAAPIYDSEEDAQDAIDDMNGHIFGRYYADGRPANAAARALAGGDA